MKNLLLILFLSLKTFALGNVVASEEGNTIQEPQFPRSVSTPVQAYDTAGEKVWECALDIYGKTMTVEREQGFVPFRFQGQYEDCETGLCYNRFRYYSPESGTYISQDPIGLAGGMPNMYAYVGDSNVQYDPFGLECWGTARKMFWKQEVINNPHLYSQRNINRMLGGKAPKMKVKVFHYKTQTFKIKNVSMELHHTSLPQRGAGNIAHQSWNLTKATPWGHASMDKYRHTGYDLVKIIKGTNSW